jgi:hypothetical protein
MVTGLHQLITESQSFQMVDFVRVSAKKIRVWVPGYPPSVPRSLNKDPPGTPNISPLFSISTSQG